MAQPIKTIAFDAFGTLAYIARPTNAYRWLLDATDTAVTSEIRARAMTSPISFEDYAREVVPNCSDDIIERGRVMLEEEVASITLFDDTKPTITALRRMGFTIAVISNLAPPYSTPLRTLLARSVDHWCLSYEVGALKPDQAIFSALLHRTGSGKEEVLMIGDRVDSDILGARQSGIEAMLLDRTSNKSASSAALCDLTELLRSIQCG